MPSRPYSILRLTALFIGALFSLVTFFACAQKSIAQAPHPATLPAERIIRLSDAVPLDKLQTDLDTNFTDKLQPPAVGETTYFGEIDEYDEDGEDVVAALPIIGLHTGETWTALPLLGEGLRNAGWKYVGAGPGKNEVWGVLDTVAGNTRGSFVVAHSTDGAKTFSLTVFHKPCRLAQFYDFAMSRDGIGRISLSLDSDCGAHKAGIYHFQTNDEGKTWTTQPRYEPDAMKRADEVPDDEQPAAPSAGTRTFLRTSLNQPIIK